MRYGDFRYDLPAANGDYTVKLKFAEPVFNAAGQRLFNVKINGQQVLTSFDVFAAAGGQFVAVDRQFPVSVTDELITVEFISLADFAFVGAIEVTPGGN